MGEYLPREEASLVELITGGNYEDALDAAKRKGKYEKAKEGFGRKGGVNLPLKARN